MILPAFHLRCIANDRFFFHAREKPSWITQLGFSCFFGRGRRNRTLNLRFWRPSLCQLSYQSKKPPLESNQPCLHTRAALQTALRRQMARYCGIEPHPISRFGGVSICTYRIDAQSAKREERKMPAKPKGGKLSWGFVSETACIGLPFRHCRWYYSITFARFLYIPRTYRVHTRSCTKNHAFFMHFRQNRKKVLLPRSLQGLQTLL